MKNLIYFLSITILILNASCSKVENVISPPKTVGPVDVYVAGHKDGHACYWKNNQIVVLDDNSVTRSTATKIIVSNGDVYVLGTFQFGINPMPSYLYWKNGVLTNLTNELSTAPDFVNNIADMEIVGNDVYFLGYTTQTTLTGNSASFVYWKNGVKTVVADYLNLNGLFNFGQIKIVNNTVFIIGAKDIAGTITKGYFVNNNFTPSFQTLNGITVNGLDVYVYGGNSNTNDIYYKNITTGQELNEFPSYSIQKMVFDGNDRYINGGIFIRKNDTTIYNVPLPDFDRIKDFEVLNGNTYIISQLGDFGTTDHLYINNVDVLNIQSNFSSMNDIAIVQN